jgi:hypothetical protein
MEQVDHMLQTAERTVAHFANMEQRTVELVMQALRRGAPAAGSSG